jgi:O-antigen/teichoic acid export membrane protein
VAIILALPPVVMQLVCTGFPSALTYFVARQRDGWRLIARRVVRAAVGQITIGVALLYGLDVYFLSNKSATTNLAGLVVILSLPLLIFQYYSVHLIQGLGDMRWFNIIRISSTGVYSGGVVAGAFMGLTVLSCAVIWVVSQTIVAALTAFALLGYRSCSASVPSADDQEDGIPTSQAIARFALSGFIGQISPIESFRLDTLVVAALFPARVVGYYSVANSVTNVPLFAADAVSAVGYPHVAAEDGERAVAVTRRYMKVAAILGGTAAAVSAALAPVIIPLVFGTAYAPAESTAVLLACAAGVLGLRRVGNDFLRALGRPALSTRLELITLAAFGASLLVLGPVGSGRGVAAALILSAAVGLLLFGRLLQLPKLADPPDVTLKASE